MKMLVFFIALLSMLHAQKIAVVVSNNNATSELSKIQVKRIFLFKTNKLNTIHIKVYEIKSTSYKKEFYKNVLGKSVKQLRAYWARLIFTGKAKPPKQLRDIEALIQKMREDTQVISYVPFSEVTASMKVLYITEK